MKRGDVIYLCDSMAFGRGGVIVVAVVGVDAGGYMVAASGAVAAESGF